MYPEEWVTPIRRELERAGFRELHTSGEVDEALGAPDGTTLLVIHTFCAHAVRARPAVALALQNQRRPDHLVTVFAGRDPIPTHPSNGRSAHADPTDRPPVAVSAAAPGRNASR